MQRVKRTLKTAIGLRLRSGWPPEVLQRFLNGLFLSYPFL